MKKWLTLILLLLAALPLDCAILPAIAPADIRPFVSLALVLAATALFSPREGLLLSVPAGLVIDLVCNPYWGLSAALLLLLVILLSLFQKKQQPKPLVLFLLFTALTLLSELLLAVISVLLGARFPFLYKILTYSLPCSLLTGGLALGLYALMRPLKKGQLGRGKEDGYEKG